MTVFIVVETENFVPKNSKLSVKIKQINPILPEFKEIKLTVGQLPHEFNPFKNKNDFKNYAIGVFKFQGSPQNREKIAASPQKHVKLYLEVDAHSTNKEYKDVPNRIKYNGTHFPDDNPVDFTNCFLCDPNEEVKLIAWKGIIVHSMGDFNGKYKSVLGNLNVHGFILEDKEFEPMCNIYENALHSGESYFDGVSNLNDSYLGFEMVVKHVSDINKLNLYAHDGSKILSNKNTLLQDFYEKFRTMQENIKTHETLVKEISDLTAAKAEEKSFWKRNELTKSINKKENKRKALEIKIQNKADMEKEKLLIEGFCFEKHFDKAVSLTRKWLDDFDISPDFVLRHSDVSGLDVRDDSKFDPGSKFPWDRFKMAIATPKKAEPI